MRCNEQSTHTHSCQGKQGKKVWAGKTRDNQSPLTASSASTVGGELFGAKDMLCPLMADLDEKGWPWHGREL